MKRLICSAAVASALLAVTAIPSGAASVGLFGMSAAANATYDDTYTFHVSTPETVMISGGEFNIADFSISGPISLTFSPVRVLLHLLLLRVPWQFFSERLR